MNINNLNEQLESFVELLNMPDLTEAQYDEYMDQVIKASGRIEDYYGQLLPVIKELRDFAKVKKDRAAELSAEANLLTNRADKVEGRLVDWIQDQGMSGLVSGEYSVKLRKTSGTLIYSGRIDDLSDDYWNWSDPKKVVDKKVMKASLNDGAQIQGAEIINRVKLTWS